MRVNYNSTFLLKTVIFVLLIGILYRIASFYNFVRRLIEDIRVLQHVISRPTESDMLFQQNITAEK